MLTKVSGFTAGIAPVGSSISAPLLKSATSITKSGGLGLGGLDPLSLGLSIGSKLIGQETINKTVGQVFANGFNLKCWGSSWSPTRAKADLPAMLEEIGYMAQNVMSVMDADAFQTSVNSFYDWFYSYRIHERNWLETTAKDCTKDGLRILIDGLDTYKKQCTDAFKQFAVQNNWEMTAIAKEYKDFRAERRNKTSKIHVERFLVKEGSVLSSFSGGTQSAGGSMLLIGVLALIFGRKFIKK